MFDVAVFGGAFDPITIGHEMVAMAVHVTTGYHLWFMPCYEHLFGKELAPPLHRLAMCRHVAERHGPWAGVSSFEIDHRHNGSTYDLMALLKRDHPHHRFHLVMGTDNFAEVKERWHKGEALLEENPCIVVGRGGYDLEAKLEGTHHTFVGLHFTCASTVVRWNIFQKDYEMARRFLTWKVADYIRLTGLYGWEAKDA